jgi:replication-associated recombination protein RarA
MTTCAIKYAPQNLSEVIIANPANLTRIQCYQQQLLSNHIILWGPNGTGKSSVARLLPKAMCGNDVQMETSHFDDLLNRKNLKTYLQNACSLNRFDPQAKYFMVFEEFDNAKVNLHKLWTAMDSCADELMVIITTNNPMEISKSMRDRCDLMEFGTLRATDVLPRAQQILAAEGLVLPDPQVLRNLLLQERFGSLRKYMGKLDELLALNALGAPIPMAAVPAAVVAKPTLAIV